MITIKNVKTLDDQVRDYTVPSLKDLTLEANGKLLLLPGLIDSHISIGAVEKYQSWDRAVKSAIKGGITTVIDIPSRQKSTDEKENLDQKRQAVDKQLSHLHIPLHYFLYAQADLSEIEELGLCKKLIKGVMVQLDADKNEELDDLWDRVFQLAAWENLPVIVNAFAENIHEDKKREFLEKVIYYAERQSTRLYILNVATQQDIDLIQKARKRALLIYAETTPQFLFQEDASKTEPLWKALRNRVIETVGSGYDANNANNPDQTRMLYKGDNLSFSDPIFLLPRLLTARREGKISIEQIVNLTHYNIHEVFNIEKTRDIVLVDLEKEEIIQKVDEKGTVNITLKGWPIHTIVQGELFS